MLVLGIESTCDESGCALVRNGSEVLSNCIASQVEVHAPFGGVVPELASRQHIDHLPLMLKEALERANLTLDAIDLISVAIGPGLIGSLLVGLNFAKGLAYRQDLPLIGVNHIEAHLVAALIDHPPICYPAIGLIVSGGHTSLYLMRSELSYELLGQTHDDAIGEAFDKVASLLGLPYPGGPEIEQIAIRGDPKRFSLKVGQIKQRPYDFSFSGIKTCVLYLIQQWGNKLMNDQEKADLSASFQEAVFQDVVSKTLLAAQLFNAPTIVVGGGVSQNKALRQKFIHCHPNFKTLFAPPQLCIDNGAMIAALGYYRFQTDKVQKRPLQWALEPDPRLKL